MKNRIISKVCCEIWNFSEKHRINLGFLAPYIFGGMIGSKPIKVKGKDPYIDICISLDSIIRNTKRADVLFKKIKKHKK